MARCLAFTAASAAEPTPAARSMVVMTYLLARSRHHGRSAPAGTESWKPHGLVRSGEPVRVSHRRQCVRGQGERQPDGRPSAAERAMALYLIAFNDERTAARQQPGGAHYPRAPRPRADGGRTFTTLSPPARWWWPAEPWNSTTPSQPASAGYRTSGSGTAPDSIGPDRRVGQNGGYVRGLPSAGRLQSVIRVSASGHA